MNSAVRVAPLKAEGNKSNFNDRLHGWQTASPKIQVIQVNSGLLVAGEEHDGATDTVRSD